MDQTNLNHLTIQIKHWATELGFQKTGVADIDLSEAEIHLKQWLDHNYHGDMHFMEKHGRKRSHPEELVDKTFRVISCRMDYLPEESNDPTQLLKNPSQAFISRYALGRDYHKLIRKRLQKLALRIQKHLNETNNNHDFNYRVFTDSAPVLEKPLAQKAGLGWIGKHSNLLDKDAGSWFFLGEIYTNLPLPIDKPVDSHCGNCTSCIDLCPTKAIVAPYQVDARRCISYLTIELKTAIPIELRSLMGNRIYGCDDCQQVCPWNRFAESTSEQDFQPRDGLDTATLLELFEWDEQTFLRKTEGSAIRRIGHQSWLRNIAVALGNSTDDNRVITALKNKRALSLSDLVDEHIDWALENLTKASQ